ncbi:TonB-dependent receptor plug domain-containing protein, partial [Aliarcobacter butzleri]
MKYNHTKLIKLSPLLIPYILFAQTTVLNEIEIKEKKELKTNSMNIDLEKTEQEQANSFKEIFKNNSSIEIGGGAINVQRIYLRGIESSNLNISLDGAKQGKNMFQHRSNELGINPDLLKIVDIKTAPDATKNSALGGSIEMSTKDAQDFVKGNKNYGSIFKTGYNTNAKQKYGNATT